MKFGELKSVINRSNGRWDYLSFTIGLGMDAIIKSESEILDYLDEYEVAWIAPSTMMGHATVSDNDMPCIEIHLKKLKEAEE